MHGGEGERKRRRHMWPVPAARTGGNTTTEAPQHPDATPLVVAAADSNHSSTDSLLKDGRRFFVGDCALFQAGNLPPFIGIIRWFSPDNQNNLKLGVSRLYRPSEVKLSKGILLEAAPNEVFYSFHKDEISAELLLHPCKVAFLRKGVELPQWVSSFVCRRVYDSANKCLWWLTDQAYIDDQQEEVAKLLAKTREEMHAAVQSGGRSPKQLNSPAQQSKSTTDATQTNNNTSSLSSQVTKGKKRLEKGDQGSDSTIKRERPSKPVDDGESSLKLEIEKITERGALMNIDAVDKFVQLMQLDKGERKIDLPGRKLLADIISATDKSECLDSFVQLKGVPLLDDWLQEAHRGKSGGDSASPKEGDKSVDELLLALLHALDKLPVNLDALQACNVGKSVNHLRGHKNSEIQKKARGLVDTWKKRIDAEMTKLELTKLKDEKSTGAANPASASSLTGKPGLSEASQGGSKRSSGEAPLKSLVGQHSSSSKSLTGKPNAGQSSAVKLTSTLTASLGVGSKDSQPKLGLTAELQLPVIEEKSSSSSQSCSSDHAKSSTSGSTLPNKVSSRSTRQRKSPNGHASSGSSGTQKEGGFNKSSLLSRSSQLEKCSQNPPANEKTGDDQGNNQRLIVRLPNPGRSPARNPNCFEESTSQTSAWSTPAATEKIDHVDHLIKLKSETNAEVDGTDNAEKSMAHVLEDSGQGSESKPGKAFNTSMSSINALIESCAKYSEACASSGGDDSGMNLLASVATGEISKSSLISPSNSAEEISPKKVKPAASADGVLTHVAVNADDVTDDDSEKQKSNGEQQRQNSSKDSQAAQSFLESKVEIDNPDAPMKEESKVNIVEAEEVKGVLPEEDSLKLVKRKRKAGSPAHDGTADPKIRVRSPKSDQSKDPMKSDIGDVKSEEQVKKVSSPVGQWRLTNEVLTSDSVDADALNSTDAGLKADDEAKEEKPVISAAKTSQSSQMDTESKVLTRDYPDENHKEAVDCHSSSTSHTDEECTKSTNSEKEVNLTKKEESISLLDASTKLDFDLNEGFSVDEVNTADTAPSSSIHLMNLQPFNSSPAPITIAAPAKGPFVPPEILLKSKDEPGWRGSAATSAFRPLSGPSNFSSSDAPTAGRLPRPHLDIDLNVADEMAVEDFSPQLSRNSGGLDLDLNRADDSAENGQPSVSASVEGGFHMLRDFDLNNGPGTDEAGPDQAFPRSQLPLGNNNLPFLPSLRLNNSEISSLSTWFPPGNAYPAMAIPSFLPERVDHGQQPYPMVAPPGSQRIMGSAGSAGPFGSDLYRGPVLSSSPAMTFSYAGFPFGSSFPLASTSYTYPNDSVGAPSPPPPGFTTVSSSYMRPYVISLHEGGSGSGSGGGSVSGGGGGKWGQQNLDLNAGPGGVEMEGRDQSRLYQGRAMKRKEPEGGWDAERFSCK